MTEFAALATMVEKFAEDREWQRFHTPKNLAMALAGEVGELVAELQWVSETAENHAVSDELRLRLSDEAADVLIYLIRFCQVTGIDLLSEARAKIARNEDRYPADLARGRAAKYTELRDGSTS